MQATTEKRTAFTMYFAIMPPGVARPSPVTLIGNAPRSRERFSQRLMGSIPFVDRNSTAQPCNADLRHHFLRCQGGLPRCVTARLCSSTPGGLNPGVGKQGIVEELERTPTLADARAACRGDATLSATIVLRVPLIPASTCSEGYVGSFFDGVDPTAHGREVKGRWPRRHSMLTVPAIFF